MNILDLGFDSWTSFFAAWWDSILTILSNTAHMLLAPETFVQHLAQVAVLVFAILALIAWVHDKGRFTDYDSDAPFLSDEERAAHLDKVA